MTTIASDSIPVAVVTGGSSGLGIHVARKLRDEEYQVILVGRSADRLRSVSDELNRSAVHHVDQIAADVTDTDSVSRLVQRVGSEYGRLDVLVNCVGQSDRGTVLDLSPDRVHELINRNVISSLLCTQAAIDLLEQSSGVVVNVGSLAAKVSPRFLGAYSIAKHALAAMTGQLRLELKPRGIHVGLINPGPIVREDAGNRYDQEVTADLPDQARRPGGGTRVSGLPPQRVANAVHSMIKRRCPDMVLPKHLRILIAIGHAFPRLGDWLLIKFTSSKS